MCKKQHYVKNHDSLLLLSVPLQEDGADPDSQEEKERNKWLSNPANDSNTVKSVLTVQEYFAQRMAKLKGSQKETETKVDHPSPTADEAVEPSEELETKVKKKKKQKRDDEAERTEHCEKPGKKLKTASLNGKELDDPLNECHKRKKKRKHKEENEGESISCDENTGNGEIDMSEGEELSTEEQEEKQKKRHKKKHKKQKEETGECGEGAPRKKKKHCKNI